MKIHFGDPQVFDGSPVSLDELRRVFVRAKQGQHELSFADVDSFFNSQFYTHFLSLSDREWAEFYRRVATDADALHREREPGTAPKQRHAEIVASATGTFTAPCRWRLSTIEAGAWAEQPLRILVENERDRVLVECAVRLAPNSPLERALLFEWVVFVQRGGIGEVKSAVEASCAAGALARERLFPFVDSDRASDRDALPSTQRLLAEACQRRGIPFHILTKREVECYVPEELLDLVSMRSRNQERLRAQFRAWRRMSDAERDFLDIEAHFDRAFKNDARDALAALDDRAVFLRRAGDELFNGPLPEMEAWL